MPIQPCGAIGIEGTIELNSEFTPGLIDLEGFSNLILLYHFHLVKGYKLYVVPFMDDKPHGIFATRSPTRPNEIGISIVKLKKNYLLLVLCFMTSLSFTEAFGQTTLDAEFRPRTEFREGFRKPLVDSLDAGIVTFQRTRFNVDYKGKILNARISLQDARIWGNSDNKTNLSKIEIYEAWFEYLITSGLSVQMGRQPLKYDDQRLFATSNWSNTGISHDVLILKFNSPFMQAHYGFAYNNSKDTLLNVAYAYTPKQNYKIMNYAWLSKQIYTGTTLSLIGIYEGFEKKTNIKIVFPRITYGGNLVYANATSGFGATLTAYLQKGINPGKTFGSGYADLNASFLAAKASYKIIDAITANIGIDYYSGSTSDINAVKSTSFDRLYGSAHSNNGYMEYFSTLPTQGLVDYYGGLNTKINPKLSVELIGHLFYLDKYFIYNDVNKEKNMGSEADLVVSYTVSNEIAIQGGYSRHFNSGLTTQYFKMQGVNVHPEQWAYLMLTIKPQLYKTPVVVETK